MRLFNSGIFNCFKDRPFFATSIDFDKQAVDSHKMLLRLISILNQPCDIVFLDECGFDNFQTMKKGWSMRGTGYI